jgi:hypothetical protein
MKIYIDCEFNEFKGDLISMALVAEDGSEFYEVLECENPKPWVAQNVMPILNKDPVPDHIFRMKLFGFLNQFTNLHFCADWPEDIAHFCADWPEDIAHFCAAIITGPGTMMNIPNFTCEVRRDLSAVNSKLLHNALADATAL